VRSKPVRGAPGSSGREHAHGLDRREFAQALAVEAIGGAEGLENLAHGDVFQRHGAGVPHTGAQDDPAAGGQQKGDGFGGGGVGEDDEPRGRGAGGHVGATGLGAALEVRDAARAAAALLHGDQHAAASAQVGAFPGIEQAAVGLEGLLRNGLGREGQVAGGDGGTHRRPAYRRGRPGITKRCAGTAKRLDLHRQGRPRRSPASAPAALFAVSAGGA